MAYIHVMSDPKRAKTSHNSLGFKVGSDIGRDKMDNIAVVVTRNYGGKHLGTRRFKLMRRIAAEATGGLF